MQANVHRVQYVVGCLFIAAGLSVSALSSYTHPESDSSPVLYCPSVLTVLFDPLSAGDAFFQHGCLEKIALRNAISGLICTRIDCFLRDRNVQVQLSEKQRSTILRIKNRLSGVYYQSKSVPIVNGLMIISQYADFKDVIDLYSLFQLVDDGNDGKRLQHNAFLQGFPFDELIARVPYLSVKVALANYRSGSSDDLLRIINTASQAELQSALACCIVMLVAMSEPVVDHVRGIASCINLIQIYEQVEQLPIESALQAMHSLLYRIGIMLDNLNQKEEGFVGWLKNKWVYLPVAVIIIAMRIAKYYWGSQNVFNSYTGGNQWGNLGQFGGNGSFGSHNPLFETRIKESNSKLKNAEVIVGSA